MSEKTYQIRAGSTEKVEKTCVLFELNARTSGLKLMARVIELSSNYRRLGYQSTHAMD